MLEVLSMVARCGLATAMMAAACERPRTSDEPGGFDPEALTDRIEQDRQVDARNNATRAEQLETFLHAQPERECQLVLATKGDPAYRSCTSLHVRANADVGIVFFDGEGRVAAWVSQRDLNRAFVDYRAPETPEAVGVYELALPPAVVISLPGADSATGVLLSEAMRGRSTASSSKPLARASTDVELALIDGLSNAVVLRSRDGRTLTGRLVDVRNDSVAIMTSDHLVVVVERASVVALEPANGKAFGPAEAKTEVASASTDPFAARDEPSMERFYALLTKAETAEGTGKLVEAASLYTRAYHALPSAQRGSEIGTDVVHAAAVVSRDKYFQNPDDASILAPCAALVQRHSEDVRRADPERDVSELERLLSSIRTLERLGAPK